MSLNAQDRRMYKILIMLEKLSNFGTALSRNELKAINGGDAFCQGGCAGLSQGDFCYTQSGGCRTVPQGRCGFQQGQQLVCIPL